MVYTYRIINAFTYSNEKTIDVRQFLTSSQKSKTGLTIVTNIFSSQKSYAETAVRSGFSILLFKSSTFCQTTPQNYLLEIVTFDFL